MPPLGTPLAHSKFNLNSAGVAGFFGGEEVLSTIGIMHLYEGRRWFGWYNNPGSYHMAKYLGRTANSPFWDGLFPGPNLSPAVVYGLDIKKGPMYVAALSGERTSTGHLAHLTMGRSEEVKSDKIQGRVTKPFDVTYLAMPHVVYGTPVHRLPIQDAPRGLVPSIISITACTMCALVYDWFSFSIILIGIVVGGTTSLIVGRAKLVIAYGKEPPPGAPSGHGIMVDGDEVMVIKGKERDVKVIQKGSFDFEKCSILDELEEMRQGDEGKEQGDERGERAVKNKGCGRKYHEMGVCAILLLLQFLLQLLFVPQGSLFGQIMFLISLCTSWGYNTYLSSLGIQKEKLQARILFQTLGHPQMQRFRAGTRMMMAVFVCLLLFHGVEGSGSSMEDNMRRHRILHMFIPNDTLVWRRWREKVVAQLLNIDDKSDLLSFLEQDKEDPALSGSDEKLLSTVLEDARAAFRAYYRVRGNLPADSSQRMVEGWYRLDRSASLALATL